jgi:hypothetical protein
MKFKVFEAITIRAEDTEIAYKSFGDRRVVTLQGSVLEIVNGFLQPTKRWLTRGELVLETPSSSSAVPSSSSTSNNFDSTYTDSQKL